MNENDLMLTSVLGCERIDLLTRRKELTPRQRSRYDHLRARRDDGEPLQYVLGQTDFMGIMLSVDGRVLIPRPETEILVGLAIEKASLTRREKPFHVLDLGAGSGNISIAIAKSCPYSRIISVDISKDALAVAAKNTSAHDVAGKIQFIHQDMADYLKTKTNGGCKFDMIISNPPYIPTKQLGQLPEDVRQEPTLALDGGVDGLDFYRTIIADAYRSLAPGGFLFMEIGDGQKESIEDIFAGYPQYGRRQFYQDYVGTDRIVMTALSSR